MEDLNETVCFQCKKPFVSDGCGTGYGVNSEGHRICYKCCAINDYKELENMKVGDSTVFYLTHKTKELSYGKETTYEITNWPGTMRINVGCKEGRHNIARVRRDVWFSYKGNNFHGVQYGNDSELCYIKRIKG